MHQPLPTDNNTPPLSQCPTCDSYVYQCVVNNGAEDNPHFGYVLVEVTPVPVGEGPYVLSREKYATAEGGDTEYPVVDRSTSGTCVPHKHQEFND